MTAFKVPLYLGLQPPKNLPCYHYPVIAIQPRNPSAPAISTPMQKLTTFSHVVFTSKTAAQLLFQWLPHFGLSPTDVPPAIAVGSATANSVLLCGGSVALQAPVETAEGVIDLMQIKRSSIIGPIFWPHSALSRSTLPDWWAEQNLPFQGSIFYDTLMQAPTPIPDLTQFDEIIFTSPSTVRGFLAIWGSLPTDKCLRAIGSVTEKELRALNAAKYASPRRSTEKTHSSAV